jgi:cobalt-zinc-cadmium efflux system membrane fusion protein
MTARTDLRSTLVGLLFGGIALAATGCSDTDLPGRAEDSASPGPSGRHEEPHGDETNGEEAHDEGIVELAGAKALAAKLETSVVESASLPAQLATTGQVDFNQDRLAHVSPRIAGRVHEARARLGQRVRRGEILAMLDSIELGRAKADYLQARARAQLTRENFEREESLFADRIASEKELLAAKAALIEAEAERRSAEETLHLYGLSDEEVATVTYENPGRSLAAIRAPLSGKIVEKHITVGELVTPERNLFSLADLSEVWVWIDIYERDLQQVHLDDEVDVRVDAYPEREFSGTVSYLSDRVDLETRRVRARIDVANPEERLRPGMFAQVELTDPHQGGGGTLEPVLVIPETALQRDGEATIVFVDLGQGRYERREVVTGRRAGGSVEVIEGLASGERVVSAGVFFLKSELARDELGEGHAH